MIADDSGVKHFDRKFVASNLQNLLRCPKCSKCYTYSYSKNQGDESYRPFLLPCGHNLCESCVWSNHQDLKCAVCQTPASPTIKSKDPAKKSSANVRDYYELNYHVLGETSSLSYFRRFASETTNKSLTLSSISEEVAQATKCSECGNAIANGECRQCNASYCRRCFEAVHNHSRVLKSHVFQITQESHSRKGLRVGKQFFTLPTKNECHQHRMLKNIFCLNCKRTNCPACISVLHRGHRTKSLLDMVSKIGNIVSVSDTMISTYT